MLFLKKKIIDEGLQHKIIVDSAGTGDWHIGRAPDPRACLAASVHGYDLTQLRARQVKPEDFNKFDYVVAMDKRNLLDLKIMAPPQFAGHLGLFLDHSRNENKEVPDPYAGGKEGFEDVLNLIEDASNGLLEHLSGQLT